MKISYIGAVPEAHRCAYCGGIEYNDDERCCQCGAHISAEVVPPLPTQRFCVCGGSWDWWGGDQWECQDCGRLGK